jgi:hypothetical protein
MQEQWLTQGEVIEIHPNSMNREDDLSLTFIHTLEERKMKIMSKDKLATLPRDNNRSTPLPGSSEKGIFCHFPLSVHNSRKKVHVFSQVPVAPVANIRVLKRTSFLSQEFLFIISVILNTVVSLLPTDLSDHFVSHFMVPCSLPLFAWTGLSLSTPTLLWISVTTFLAT